MSDKLKAISKKLNAVPIDVTNLSKHYYGGNDMPPFLCGLVMRGPNGIRQRVDGSAIAFKTKVGHGFVAAINKLDPTNKDAKRARENYTTFKASLASGEFVDLSIVGVPEFKFERHYDLANIGPTYLAIFRMDTNPKTPLMTLDSIIDDVTSAKLGANVFPIGYAEGNIRALDECKNMVPALKKEHQTLGILVLDEQPQLHIVTCVIDETGFGQKDGPGVYCATLVPCSSKGNVLEIFKHVFVADFKTQRGMGSCPVLDGDNHLVGFCDYADTQGNSHVINANLILQILNDFFNFPFFP